MVGRSQDRKTKKTTWREQCGGALKGREVFTRSVQRQGRSSVGQRRKGRQEERELQRKKKNPNKQTR